MYRPRDGTMFVTLHSSIINIVEPVYCENTLKRVPFLPNHIHVMMPECGLMLLLCAPYAAVLHTVFLT